MLQTIREHTQGWIAGTIISIIILTFALWGIHSYFEGGGSNNVVADVNGTQITNQQLASAYERLKRQLQAANQTAIANNDALLKTRALQGLIEIEVLKQAAIAQGFFVSWDQVYGYLQSLPDFQVNGQFSPERLQQILSSALLSQNQFLELVQASLLIDQPKLGIAFSAAPLPYEVDSSIALINQERDIDYVNIPTKIFLEKIKDIPAGRIEAYYKENKKLFMTPEKISVEYVLLSLPEVIKQIQPTQQELLRYYDENQNAFTSPMQWKLQGYKIPMKDDSPAAVKETELKAISLREDLLQGKKVPANSGYEPYLTKQTFISITEVPEEVQKQVSNLVKPNQVTQPLKTSDGWVVIKAIEIKAPQPLKYEAALPKIEELYKRMKGEERFSELREQLADAVYEHPDSLEPAAEKLKLKVQSTQMFSRDTGNQNDISQFKNVRELAYGNEVLNAKNNSDVIQPSPEVVVAIHLKSHEPAAPVPLSQVQTKISEELKKKQAETASQQYADELLLKLKQGSDLKQTAQTQHLHYNSVGFIGRYSEKVDSAILDKVFRMPHPKNKVVYSITQIPNGYAIIALKSVRVGKIEEKQKIAFAEQVQNANGLLEYELYKLSMLEKAKIKVTQ